jgi:hypothetical protein
MRKLLAPLFASVVLFGGLAGTVSAQPVDQDGLVNVYVNDVLSHNDVNIGVAAQIAANICGVKVGPIAVIGAAVDRSGATRTACTTGDQVVEFRQNT